MHDTLTSGRWPAAAILLIAALAVVTACRRADGGDATPAPSEPPAATATQSPSDPTPTQTPGATATVPPETAPPPQPGVFSGSLTVDGRERSWRLYVPDSLPGGPVPLVVGLHGAFGSGAQFARASSFDEQAEAGGFIAAYPDGTGIAPTWNGGSCCGYATRRNVDDVAFIEAMIDAISAEYRIDPARIYAAGHSNGAIMALRLACESDRFRAVGGVAGSLELSECRAPGSVSVLLIQGDADGSHPLEGGRGEDTIAGINFTSVADSMALLAPAMGCSNATDESVDGPITTTSWQGCPDGVAVQLKVIAGAGHPWPGGPPGITGPATDALDATSAIWGFFAVN